MCSRLSYTVSYHGIVFHYKFVNSILSVINLIFIIMHFKVELRKIIDNSKLSGCCPMIENSLFIKLLYSARHDDGEPLVNIMYDLIEFGFNPFKHEDDPLLKILIKNIIAVCDKELSLIKTHPNEKKKKNK